MNCSESARAICPFYKKIQGTEIQCECCVRRARLLFAFRRREDAVRYKRKYCDTYSWGRCPYAKMREGEYAGDEV